MILIVGLGNPGKKYEKTRHNIGRLIINEFARKNNFPNFNPAPCILDTRYKRKKIGLGGGVNALISKGVVASKKIILALPETFMNLSGKSVKSLIKMYQLNKAMAFLSEYLWVVHDDINLPLGKIRISKGRGAAGHKGVESIIKSLGTKNFVRFRIGICPKLGKPKRPEKFVLQKFNRKEEKIVKEVIKKTAEAIEFSLREGLEKAMSKYNK